MSSQPTRREFVATVAATAVLAGPALHLLADRGEAVPPPVTKSDTPNWIPTIKPADLIDGAQSDKFAKTNHILLARDKDTIYAMYNYCPHKGCAVGVKADVFECPCHHARFSNTGAVTKGPAKTDLRRFALRLNDKGLIEVDVSHVIDASDKNSTLVVPAAAQPKP